MSCPICLCEIELKHTTKCNHDFCNECLTKWLETKNSCPLCRGKLKEEVRHFHTDTLSTTTSYIPFLSITERISNISNNERVGRFNPMDFINSFEVVFGNSERVERVEISIVETGVLEERQREREREINERFAMITEIMRRVARQREEDREQELRDQRQRQRQNNRAEQRARNSARRRNMRN